jgi:N-acetylmuramoyl-L-alanine amidase
MPTRPPTPSPSPTVSPTPIPLLHAPPYRIAIEAGHGGPYYFGASAYDDEGRQWIEKDLNLDLSQRVRDLLIEGGYEVGMLRTSDTTLTNFDTYDYRGSLIREAQARVDLANSSEADVYVALHFNGWIEPSQRGTEAYCNPDRSFRNESCQLAWMIEQTVVRGIHEAGYDVTDRGVKNDSDVQGPASVEHSWVLGTDPDFRPALMPGAIIESLFLSNPNDLAFLHKPEALDVIAAAIKEGIDSYFGWLSGQ